MPVHNLQLITFIWKKIPVQLVLYNWVDGWRNVGFFWKLSYV